MRKLKEFEKAYREALKNIAAFCDDLELGELTRWMLETDANPYAYLPEGWAGALETAEGFSSLLNHIHHAVYDDGDITFVTVNGEPRIVFAHQADSDFREAVLSQQEKDLEKRPIFGKLRPQEIEVLNDLKPSEFGKLYDAYQEKDLRRCFSIDAGRLGIDFATGVYNRYTCFSQNWEQECAEEIKKWANFYNKKRSK
jgi:hypothetical protein